MKTEQDQQIFEMLRDALITCEGEAEAYTLQGLAEYCGCSRRKVEAILEERLEDLGFAIVSGSAGYWRPQSADEINHYVNSLQSRAVKIFLRKKRVIRLAKNSGFLQEGKTFTNPPTKQREFLFASMEGWQA